MDAKVCDVWTSYVQHNERHPVVHAQQGGAEPETQANGRNPAVALQPALEMLPGSKLQPVLGAATGKMSGGNRFLANLFHV